MQNTNQSHNNSSALFKKLVHVYRDEEIIRIESGRSKKSSRSVSASCGVTLQKFFAKQLNIPGLIIERSKKGGLFAFSIHGKVFATLKYMTDIGYRRGDSFYEVIDDVVKMSKELFDVDADQVFIVVSSLKNSTKKSYVETLLEQKVASNPDFLSNRGLVQQFIEKYLIGISHFLNGRNNVLFMAAEIHPNILANDLLNKEMPPSTIYEMIDNYGWLSSIDELLERLKVLSKNACLK
ncbi:hypothetical protein [Sporosarcina sp. YIM B06819]|uniref:hypothetical protein n=1 Tax=Sporosarcina sp. YIM B06819 TaxID=3081769 RepID=UPI00298CD93E|nr:hypothetical protein [Sporosarcina sp. YIM B06819]